nr:uncharacterized protein LOC129384981 isoform X2 [Dermacentor andersoni]
MDAPSSSSGNDQPTQTSPEGLAQPDDPAQAIENNQPTQTSPEGLAQPDDPAQAIENNQDVEALTLSTTVSEDLTLNSDVLSSMTTAMANHGFAMVVKEGVLSITFQEKDKIKTTLKNNVGVTSTPVAVTIQNNVIHSEEVHVNVEVNQQAATTTGTPTSTLTVTYLPQLAHMISQFLSWLLTLIHSCRNPPVQH